MDGGEEGYFMYVTAEEEDQAVATFLSNEFDSVHHASECFTFWYFIEV